jgi:hypothetical protein
LQRIEASLESTGLPGRPCLLRTICEVQATPIADRHIAGAMIANFFL